MSDNILHRAMTWLSGRDTGTSSMAIFTHMLGGVSSGDYPHDTGDLGRCLRLLELVPEWTPRMGEMAKYGGAWIELSERWTELSSLAVKDAEQTYALLQKMELAGMKRDPSYNLHFSKEGRLTGWSRKNRHTTILGGGVSISSGHDTP